MLSDYYHDGYLDPVADAVGTDDAFNVYVPPSDNNYINGKTSWRYDCLSGNNSYGIWNSTQKSRCTLAETHSGIEEFRFESKKIHKLRLINSGAAAYQYFSIDEHELEVITNDFVPIVPYNTSYVGLGIGQRADVLVRATGYSNSSYWMRASVGTNCSAGAVNETKARISYERASPQSIPTSQPQIIPGKSVMCKNVSKRNVPLS
jgi:FtsP/CotA-like multicopper oxidase with cupredoxin domain